MTPHGRPKKRRARDRRSANQSDPALAKNHNLQSGIDHLANIAAARLGVGTLPDQAGKK
jgi:hypothetical protein